MTTETAGEREALLGELLSAALMMIERADWARVEVFDERLTRPELCARIRSALTARAPQPPEPGPSLIQALRFYAGGQHYHADPDTLDSVSGEPANWLCNDPDEPIALTIEDGGIARMALQGLTFNWMDGDEDNTPKPIEGENWAAPKGDQPPEPAGKVVTIAQGRNAGKQVQLLVDLPNGSLLYAARTEPGAEPPSETTKGQPPAPAGWQLAPIEPTYAMESAGKRASHQVGQSINDVCTRVYKAMLAEAPKP